MKKEGMFERIRIYLRYEDPELIDKFFIGLCFSLIIVCIVVGGILYFHLQKEEQARERMMETDSWLKELQQKQDTMRMP